MAVSLQALFALVLVHLKAAHFFEIAHGKVGWRVGLRKDLLGKHDLGDVGLGAGGGVLVHHTGLGGLVHRGGVGVGGSLGGFLVFARSGGEELLVQGLQTGLGRLVTRGEAGGLTGGLDGGFGVGHGEVGSVGWFACRKRSQTQSRFAESRVICRLSALHGALPSLPAPF